MKYAIVGSGKIGTALARIFARKNIEVAMANSRGPDTLAWLAEALGPSVIPQSIQDAYAAEMIFLSVPFPAHKDVAKQFNEGQRQVVFVSSNDADAGATVAAVATQLGFAPIERGRLGQGGVPLHVVGGQPGGLLLQNLVKLS